MFLFILEGLGTSELLLILVVALIIFGPRKLPQLSRQLGKSLADFRRASEDFKQTWEKEVGRESAIHEALTGEAMLPAEDRSILGDTGERTQVVIEAGEKTEEKIPADSQASLQPSTDAATIARGSAAAATTTTAVAPEPAAPTRKRDWL